MRTGTLLRRYFELGEKPGIADIMQIERDLNAYEEGQQTVRGILSGAVVLEHPLIHNPVFGTSVLSSINLNRTTDTAIATGGDAPVEFETATTNGLVNFKFDISTPTRVTLVYPGQAFVVLGKVTWAGSATGYRNVKIEAFDADNVSLGSDALNSHAGFAATDNIYAFQTLISENLFPTMSYFVFTVGHTNGSALNLLNFNVNLFIV